MQAPNVQLVNGANLDDAAGDGFAVVVPPNWTGADDSLESWASIGATVLRGEVPFVAGAVVVRPDRYVAGIAETPDELSMITRDLMEVLS